MYTRDLKSNDGTIKSPKDLKGKYCLQPFTNIDIHSNNGVNVVVSRDAIVDR